MFWRTQNGWVGLSPQIFGLGMVIALFYYTTFITEQEVESRLRAKFELKKAIKIGGECIVSEQQELEELGRFDAKGMFYDVSVSYCGK